MADQLVGMGEDTTQVDLLCSDWLPDDGMRPPVHQRQKASPRHLALQELDEDAMAATSNPDPISPAGPSIHRQCDSRGRVIETQALPQLGAGSSSRGTDVLEFLGCRVLFCLVLHFIDWKTFGSLRPVRGVTCWASS